MKQYNSKTKRSPPEIPIVEKDELTPVLSELQKETEEQKKEDKK